VPRAAADGRVESGGPGPRDAMTKDQASMTNDECPMTNDQ
jgi:hypothetical protein